MHFVFNIYDATSIVELCRYSCLKIFRQIIRTKICAILKNNVYNEIKYCKVSVILKYIKKLQLNTLNFLSGLCFFNYIFIILEVEIRLISMLRKAKARLIV